MKEKAGAMAANQMQDRWMKVEDVLVLAKERLDEGKLDGAEHLLRQIVSFKPRHVDAHHYLSLVSYRQGRLRDAIRHAEKAAKLAPKNAVFHSNLAQMYRLAGKLPEARTEGQRALALRPEFPEALNNLGIVCFEMGSYEEAADSYRRAVAQKPDFPEALNNLGNALRLLGRLEEAAAAFRQALERRPDYGEALTNWGVVARDSGDLEEAQRLLDRAVAVSPKSAAAHSARARLALLRGDWRSGLPEYEWRRGLGSFKRPHHRGETWQGEPLAGKRLLVYAEQAVGETLAAVRFLPALGALGPGELVFLVEPRLVPLLAPALPGVTVVEKVSPLEAFDFSVPLQSLPLRLGLTGPEAFKPLPYLAALPEQVERWTARLAALPRPWTAVAWRAEGGRRAAAQSLPFERLGPLLAKAEGTVLLTQAPPAGAPLPANCRSLEEELPDYASLAGLAAVAELAIAVDNPLAHLSGAMGRDTWVLLQRVPDWRWGLEGEQSRLYARTRLFRCAGGGWEGALEALTEALTGP